MSHISNHDPDEERRIPRPLYRLLEFVSSWPFDRLNFELKPVRTIRPWRYDADFLSCYHEMKDLTLVGADRCYMLWQFAKAALAAEGDYAELGVYRGGTARLLAELAGRGARRLLLCDTFEGLPSPDPVLDGVYRQGDFAGTSVAAVKRFLDGRCDLDVIAGDYADTLPAFPPGKLAFVHVDCDLHRSVDLACRHLWPLLSAGGVMLFDDYGFRRHYGARQAVDDYFAGARNRPVYLPTGQCVVTKAVPEG